MNFEWDEIKRKINLDKHGIDFIAAATIFDDIERIETEDDRQDYGEERIQVIGEAKPGILFVVYTGRDSGGRMTDKKYTKDQLDKLQDKTDYERLKRMSEDEIEKNAEDDADSLSPTEEQMKKFKKVKK